MRALLSLLLLQQAAGGALNLEGSDSSINFKSASSTARLTASCEGVGPAVFHITPNEVTFQFDGSPSNNIFKVRLGNVGPCSGISSLRQPCATTASQWPALFSCTYTGTQGQTTVGPLRADIEIEEVMNINLGTLSYLECPLPSIEDLADISPAFDGSPVKISLAIKHFPDVGIPYDGVPGGSEITLLNLPAPPPPSIPPPSPPPPLLPPPSVPPPLPPCLPPSPPPPLLPPPPPPSPPRTLSTTTVFQYTGGEQSFSLEGVLKFRVTMWGAGGQTGAWGNANGGSGGFATAGITLSEPASLKIIVGQQGSPYNGRSYGGGGRGGPDGSSYGGGGGGRSAIRITGANEDLITAGGGGGGGYTGYPGGNGGSSSNGAGSDGAGGNAGRGASTSSGGARGTGVHRSGTAGSKYMGGEASQDNGWGAGGGGGGYYGGGGGGGSDSAHGGGGGGSSFTGPYAGVSYQMVAMRTEFSDPLYNIHCSGKGQADQHGCVIISPFWE